MGWVVFGGEIHKSLVTNVWARYMPSYTQYVDDHYSERVNLSYSRFADLIATSGSLLLFYHEV